PAATTWLNKTAPNTSSTTLDPILFTDRYTGRTFASQLAGECSRAAYTDTAAPFNDGDQWVPSQGCGVPAGVDHQTMGGGPLASPLTRDPNGAVYPDGVYYCSQSGTNEASCANSLDGGLTFGPAVPIYVVNCFGIHGHVKVAPDGTAYVPNSDCSTSTTGPGPNDTARQGLVFSEDNGTTWSQPQLVPDSNPAPGIVDPSIGISPNGTIYYGYANSNGAPSIAVGHKINHQIVWSPSQDVGAALGIQNSTFPEVVAGDDNRAAYAFLGTTTGGYYQDPSFEGTWYLYVATTYDGGATWTTVNATPNDPVQRGSICNSGTVICGRTPNDRNLLDFMDATMDRQGRVEVAYPDGCITAACIQGVDKNSDGKINRFDNDQARKATIARQSGGRRMLVAFDPPVEPTAPAAPRVVSATRDAAGVHLAFLEPDNGGSPITAYRIYRGTTSGGETLLATIGTASTYDITNLANKVVYDDTTTHANRTYFYRVTAVNASGEGLYCTEFQLNALCTNLNVAQAVNGALAIASSTYSSRNYSALSAIDGERAGANWELGGGWNDATRDVWPDSLEVNFNGSKTVDEIRVYTLQNNFKQPVEPTATTPADLYGIRDFDVQYWNGLAWATVPGGSVTNNDKAMRVFTFDNITTTKIRVLVNNGRAHFSRITEVEAFGCPAS
ncbi:MAG: hypothetical protein LC754_13440, partial [Acidobacteria bacterium]|nr:hypothetical protein [Acidobacteriota bacterium]